MTPPTALTIAGSDCCAGAGLQADLKTFHHFGVHGLTAATCVVAETPREVRAIHPIPPEILRAQLELLLESYPIAAVKTGMLFAAEPIRVVAEVLAAHPGFRLVVDPVMIASTGDPLLEPDAIAAYQDLLLPMADVITPNLDEARVLAAAPIADEAAIETAAAALAERFGTAVLLKGGHLDHSDCADYLHHGPASRWFRSPRIATRASHGTGCTLSAAIAAALAHGASLADAVAQAKDFINGCLDHALHWDHFSMLNHALPSPPSSPSSRA
jgi:hydroxymethylpyrimidine/phosphomethylpyrimidine kinase